MQQFTVNSTKDRLILALLLLAVPTVGGFGIISLVYQVTGWRMPNWLAWSILTAGGVSVIAGLLATYGGVTVAPWVVNALFHANNIAY